MANQENKVKKSDTTIIKEAYEEMVRVISEAEENAKHVLVSNLQPEYEKLVRETLAGKTGEPFTEAEEDETAEEDEEGKKQIVTEKEDEIEDEPLSVSEDELNEYLDSEEVEVDLRGEDDEEVSRHYNEMSEGDELEIEDEGGEEEFELDLNEEDETEEIDMGDLEESLEDETCENGEEVVEEAIENDVEGETEEEADVEEGIADRHLPKKNHMVKPAHVKALRGESYVKEINRLKKQKNDLIKEHKAIKAEKAKLDEQVNKMQKSAGDYKKLLETMKGKMGEMLHFNTNLANVNRLFVENATTKAEKADIISKFDSTSTVTESNKLYENLKKDLKESKKVSASVDEQLNESVSYENKPTLSEGKEETVDPAITRMKQLIKR